MFDLISIRHTLHAHPELSGKETATSHRLEGWLRDTAPTLVKKGLGGNGLLARFESGVSGPRLLLRADMDALPLLEAEGRSYASRTEGLAHLCGHDGHMTILLAVAEDLARNPIARGSVDLLFQPAEETGNGARAVLSDPWMAAQHYDGVFALHNLPGYDLGEVLLKPYAFASASRGLILRLAGTSSHAAEPEAGRSPAMALASLIEQCSSLPQFMSSFGEAAKVTVIHACLGSPAFGSSPAEAVLMLTLRNQSDEGIERLGKACLQFAEAAAGAWDLRLEHEWTEVFPASDNDPVLVSRIASALAERGHRVRRLEQAFAWSEDFGHFLARSPGVLFGLGAGRELAALHHPDYDFPDNLIEPGLRIWRDLVNHMLED